MASTKSPVSLLQEFLIRRKETPIYTELSLIDGKFKYSVEVRGVKYEGEGVSKKSGKADAAKAALKSIAEIALENVYSDIKKSFKNISFDSIENTRVQVMESIDTNSLTKKNLKVMYNLYLKSLKGLKLVLLDIKKRLFEIESELLIPLDLKLPKYLTIKRDLCRLIGKVNRLQQKDVIDFE